MAMFDRSIAVRCYRGEKKEGSKGRETGSREEREGKLSISCDKAQLIAIFIRIRIAASPTLSHIRHSFTFTCRTTQFEYSASIYINVCVCVSVYAWGI